jgi:glycine/D-amino acid oxidase-like deaminating enzyme
MTTGHPPAPTGAELRRALADAAPRPFWLDQAGAPPHSVPLVTAEETDLAVIGGGFSGLWTALLAKEREPARDVILLEGRTIGSAATGRNGGFCAASLTHGLANGLARFPEEIAELERLGRANLDEIEATVTRYGIDCDFARTGELTVALEPWQVRDLAEYADLSAPYGGRFEVLDAAGVRAEVNSPAYLGGVWDRDGCALVDPARLAWGLRQACLSMGVRIHERSPVRRLEPIPGRLRLHTAHGRLDADRVALATGAQTGLLRRLGHYVLPVYDYALVTEPLSAEQLASIGWANRQGIGDAANQFHYYRLTADQRILWGGYDAVYYAGGRISAARDQRPQTFLRLARHFYDTFPQLSGVRFTHRWGGVIDTCSRFCAFYGRAYGGRLAYAVGYTGLGVGATRFGARVMLDLLRAEETDLTRLKMVRTRPVPFPPEPVRTGVIQLTRWSIARADRREGRRNLWLRTLDRFGVGFDS